MKIIDRYIIRQTLYRFAILLGLVLFILLMERLVRLLDLLATKNTPLDVILRMMVNLVPHYLSLALSTAFFISVLMAILRLREDSELDAFYAGGVSLYRIAAPIMALAVVFVLLAALIIGVLQPHARYGYRNLLHYAGYGSWYSVLDSGAFLTAFEGLTMTVGDISDDGRRLKRVFVREQSDGGQGATITAEEGSFEVDASGKLVLTLTNATQLVNRPGQEPLVLRIKQISRQIDTLFTPPPFRPRGRDERELTIMELAQAMEAPPPGVEPEEVVAEYHARLVRIGSVLVLPLLAIALGAVAPRRQQSVSLALGLLLLIVYNEIIQFGEDMVEEGRTTAWVGQELPFALFTLLSLLALVRASGRSGNSWLAVVGQLVDMAAGSIRAALRPRGA